MARKAKPDVAQPIVVDAIHHKDKRTNIPTADAQIFISPEIEEVRQIRLERDETLDPQLVWKGKYNNEGAGSDLIADAPPIYIQEKIVPRVLIENLRKTAELPQDEPELTLFDSFDGLQGFDEVEFYEHDANWSNRMILGDGLQVMASLAERERLRGQVQMVYIDPPYGIKFGSNWQVSARKRDVKDGKLSDLAREVEQIRAFRDTWELGIHSYLSYLRDRLFAARDLLRESGSCFVQIGDENVHLVRALMDEVFGRENFVASIDYFTTSGRSSDFLDVVSDTLLWYARNRSEATYRPLWKPRAERTIREQYTRLRLRDGSHRTSTKEERDGTVAIPEGAEFYTPGDMTSSGANDDSSPYTFQGCDYGIAPNTHWKTNRSGLDRLTWADRLVPIGARLRYVRLASDFPWAPYTNVWDDTVISGYADPKVYVVQTSRKVIERCMLMCTDPGDLVVDPTCGSGTTAYVAEQWGRRWITADTSRVALALARQRIMAAKYPWYLLSDSVEGHAKEQSMSGGTLPQQEFNNDVRHGFVYERVQHITLKSIANNPDIREGMGRSDIEAAIARHCDSELLYDRPFENKKKVRVAGPFTVESLNPHRALNFGEEAESPTQESGGLAEAAQTPGRTSFEQSILDNLAVAGIQNGRRKERIAFAAGLEAYAGEYIQAIGEHLQPSESREVEISGVKPGRIAISLGPQYGTVDTSFVKDAAREALKADGVELLCVLGFAFDPQVSGGADLGDLEITDGGFATIESSRDIGRLRVLLVRMNADLLMGEDLLKTGSANLFTVFGEPDITLDKSENGLTVSINGVDVYDPTTGTVRSSGIDRIAIWMIDTNYNSDSFFVRHCYFTGSNDPYKRLKKALKSDIDSDAWKSLNSSTSRPFSPPDTGKIAVKVINDYGDEVMKIFEV